MRTLPDADRHETIVAAMAGYLSAPAAREPALDRSRAPSLTAAARCERALPPFRAAPPSRAASERSDANAPVLQLRDLVEHYPAVGGESVRAVDGVSLNVEAGEIVALYGPSGSGKMTLLLMTATPLTPTSGAVLIGGDDVFSRSEREASDFRLAELGFIRQNSTCCRASARSTTP